MKGHSLRSRLGDTARSSMDRLYRHAYFLYKPIYYAYKRKSDKEKICLLKERIKPGMVVLDIGANIGFYTVLLSKLVGPTGKVYAYEPDKKNFARLEKALRRRTNVIAFNAAVGEKSGTIRLYRSDDLNVDHQTYDSGEGRAFEEILCVAIDDSVHEARVDFVKIDIQGFERAAFTGMRTTIARSPGLFVLSEFWPYGLTRAGTDPTEYLAFLREIGLIPEEEPPKGEYASKSDDKHYYRDIVSVRK